MSYFYFLSSLPLLLFDRKPVVSIKYFLKAARSCLSDGDFKILPEARLDPVKECSKSNSFLREWTKREFSLRIYLAINRAVKSGFSYILPSVPEPDSEHQFYSSQIINENNPRIAEILIDKGRWQFIDDYTKNDFFDLNSTLAYYLKLQINTRNFNMNSERGEDGYNTILESYKIRFSSEIFSRA